MTTRPPRISFSAVALLMTIALSAPTALAGTPDEPEFNDAAFDAGAGMLWADLHKGWFEQLDGDTLRVNIMVNHVPEPHPGIVYAVVFDAMGKTYAAALVMIDAIYYEMSDFDRDRMETSNSKSIRGSYTTGMDGVISLDIPLSRLPEGTDTLTNLWMVAVDIKAGPADGPFIILDESKGQRDFAFTAQTPAPQPGTTTDTAPTATTPAPSEAGSVAPAATEGADEPERTVPAASPIVALGAAVLVALAARRAR